MSYCEVNLEDVSHQLGAVNDDEDDDDGGDDYDDDNNDETNLRYGKINVKQVNEDVAHQLGAVDRT